MSPALNTLLVREWLEAGGQGLEDWQALQRRDRVERPVLLVGAGTCGLSAGAAQVRQALAGEIAAAGAAIDIVEVGCIGLCSDEPLVDLQLPGRRRLSFRRVQPSQAAELVAAAQQGRLPEGLEILGQFDHAEQEAWPGLPRLAEHPFFAPQQRCVLAGCGLVDPGRIEEAVARGGWQAFARLLRERTPAREICAAVEASGLRGRGGGGFPTGRKWALALNQPAESKVVICNADEGDPGAFMDRAVIEGDPHRVLEGLAIAALGIGAEDAWIYIRAEYPLAIQRLRQAIAQAEACGLLGEGILGGTRTLRVRIKMGAGAFVCGEETALIHSIEGKRGMPRPRPPYPVERGLFDRPTVINNVETLANLPGIFAAGAATWARLGTAGSKGTKVFALSGHVARTGLVEVAMGTPVRAIVEEIGGGVPEGRALKAVQIGGPSGGCLPADRLDVPVDYESLKELGAMMGSGGLVVMDERSCMVDVAAFFMDFIQRESCGKCIPCREGTRQLKAILDSISRGRRAETERQALERFRGVMSIERLAGVIQDASLCGLGQSAPNPVLSVLHWFREEVEAHVYERRCPAGVCPDLLLYSIETELCNGCTACARRCPVDAIVGVRKSPHHIIAEKCIGCGECLGICPTGAVKVS
jgi:NADH:ubiquinone oxidoreductase subunit F (NADH-binding)/NAD-dependent dihydropyrimidine dehydrogenase PreA subunit/(2Fe-2S) ferredoxin